MAYNTRSRAARNKQAEVSSSTVPQLLPHRNSDTGNPSPPKPTSKASDIHQSDISNKAPKKASTDEQISRHYVSKLQEQKVLAEKRLKEFLEESEGSDEEEATDAEGGRLSPEFIGLGPEGTLLISHKWRPTAKETDPSTTNQLPSVRYMDMDQDEVQISSHQPEFVQGSSRNRGFGIDLGGLPEFVIQ